MFFRAFITVIALFCAYIAIDSARIGWAKYSAHKVPDSYVQASKEADISVVEFLDYGCGHCQDLHPILMRALERDGRIKYIIRPIPSNQSDTGTEAAKIVYAAGRQGKFIEAHNKLIENYRAIDEAYTRSFAADLGIDAEQLLKDMNDPEIEKTLQKNVKILGKLKAQVVPALLVNNKVLLQVTERVPDSDELLSVFDRARRL